MKTIDVCFYIGKTDFNINNLPAAKDTISVQREEFNTCDVNIMDSVIKEAIMCLAERYNQDYEEILVSEKYQFTVSMKSFCEAPDGSRISGYVGADMFYSVVQAEINGNELLADTVSCPKSTEPKCTSSTKTTAKKNTPGDTLFSSVGFATWL